MSVLNIQDYGAQPDGTVGVDFAANANAIQAAIDDAAGGGHAVYIPSGCWSYDATLLVPGSSTGQRSVVIMGVGPQSVLCFRGTGAAMAMHRAEQLFNVHLQRFVLEGNGGAGRNGIALDTTGTTGSNHLATMESVAVRGFPDGYGLLVAGAYLFSAKECHFSGCYDGVRLADPCIDPSLLNCWIRDCLHAGLVVDSPTIRGTVSGSIIDASAPGREFVGVELKRGGLTFSQVHFEALTTAVDASEAEGTLSLEGCVFAGGFQPEDGTGEIVTLGDDVFASVVRCSAPERSPYFVSAGRATQWSGNRLRVRAPVLEDVGAVVLDRVATVTELAPAAEAAVLGLGSAALGFGDVFTLAISSEHVTLAHDDDHAPGRLLLRDGQRWSPSTGDAIHFRRVSAGDGSIVHFVEMSRTVTRHSHLLTVENADGSTVVHEVREGDHGRIISNGESVGPVRFSLPDTREWTRGLSYVFTRSGTGPVVVAPNGSDWIRGGARGAGLILAERGSSVTLTTVIGGSWNITSSHGAVSFEPGG